MRQLCAYLLQTDDAHPQLPTPHLGNIVRNLRAREATVSLLSEVGHNYISAHADGEGRGLDLYGP